MDGTLVYSKTPAGEEATRQRTRVVQRNLRMVLLQVDGQLDVEGLVAKIGNESLVFGALRELEKGGYIALSLDAPSVWEQGKQKVKKIGSAASAQISQLSSFGPSKAEPLDSDSFEPSIMGEDSTFGAKTGQIKKAVFAAIAEPPSPPAEPEGVSLPKHSAVRSSPSVSVASKGHGLKDRFAAFFAHSTTVKPSSVNAKKTPVQDLAPYRKKSWSLRIAGALLFFLLACLSVMFFYPYNSHRSAIEDSMRRIVGMPVRIGSVGIHVYPQPSLVLSDVRLGDADELRIGSLVVPRLHSLYGSGPKRIQDILAKDMLVQPDFLATLPRLLSGVKASKNLMIERVQLTGMKLMVAGASLDNLEGKIGFGSGEEQGDLLLVTPGRGLQFHLKPVLAGVEVAIQGPGWKPSENSPYNFSLVFCKGLLQPGRLSLSSTEFGLANGIFKGRWLFDWSRGGMSMAANGALTNFDAKKLMSMLAVPLDLDGRLSGNLVLSGAGADWSGMWSGVDATLALKVEHGVLGGVDFGEAMRRGAGNSVRGGQTKFDRLKGDLVLSNRRVVGKNISIESGLSNASGQFVAKNDHSVEANVQMNILGTSVPIRAPLRVTGSLPVLQTVVEN